QHLTLPPPPAPDAPGPFAFADPERVRGILARAGFGDIVLEELHTTLTLGGGGTVDQAVRFLTEGVGPVSGVLREADPAVRPTVATPRGSRRGSRASSCRDRAGSSDRRGRRWWRCRKSRRSCYS